MGYIVAESSMKPLRESASSEQVQMSRLKKVSLKAGMFKGEVRS